VVDAEVIGMIRRVLGDVDTGRDEMLLDMIERVGIGGDFLKEKETARRLRAGVHFAPVISTRQAYDQWVADGRDEVARARERMDVLFAARAERGRPLADDTLAELAGACGVTPGMARELGH
jgi:trimethylamine:corrinoid methyltransferase-like protein